MAKTVGPLFSLHASGSVGGVLTYVCGTIVQKMKLRKEKEPSESQEDNQTKWKEGCEVWSGNPSIKPEWKVFLGWVASSDECPVEAPEMANGFQLFMMFYMKEGPDGWPNYPSPPPTD